MRLEEVRVAITFAGVAPDEVKDLRPNWVKVFIFVVLLGGGL